MSSSLATTSVLSDEIPVIASRTSSNFATMSSLFASALLITSVNPDVSASMIAVLLLAAFVVMSSDAEEVAGLSDRSFVIDRGQLVAEFERGVTAAELMAATALRRDRQAG